MGKREREDNGAKRKRMSRQGARRMKGEERQRGESRKKGRREKRRKLVLPHGMPTLGHLNVLFNL